MASNTIFLVADHGLAVVYYLQTDVMPRLLEAGYEVVVLLDDGMVDVAGEKWSRPGLSFEGLRINSARQYEQETYPELQWWLQFLRRVGGSRRINTRAMDSYIEQVAVEQSNWRRLWMPIAFLLIGLLRRSRWARQALVRLQGRFQPDLYGDLLEERDPALVVASTPGWRYDRYLLREAHAMGISTAAVIVGWDNPSSYSIPGASVDFVNCWSKIQAEELVLGSDWDPKRVHVGGMPIYDGYVRKEWVIPRSEYLRRHGLDPDRKLLAYACSFVSFSPNIQNVRALIELLRDGLLAAPCQLLIRLHPNHFADVHLFRRERQEIEGLAAQNEHVHVVSPVPLGGGASYYSGEDMDEKSSMMAHADVFLTVYSTMVVEAAVHERPIVSVCIDQPAGWDTPRKYSLPLSRIGDWPTHQRFRESGAGKVVYDSFELQEAVNSYLEDTTQDASLRERFLEREVAYLDGSAGAQTAAYLLALADRA